MGIYTPNSPYPFAIRPQSPNPRIRRPEDATLVRYGDIRYLLQNGIGGLVDTTAAEIYDMAVNEKLNPGTSYRITDYRSVNWLNGYWNAQNNVAPSTTLAFRPYAPVNTNLGSGADDSVYAIAKDTVSDGVYVGGVFLGIDGNSPGYFQKLNSDGTPNTTFNNNYNTGSGFDGAVLDIAVQNDGKVLVGGIFTDLNGTTRNKLVRFNADGTVDTAFYTNLGTAFDTTVYKIAIQPDGKILVGGGFGTFNGNVRNGLVRLNADGTEDATFAANIGAAAGVGGIVRKIVVSQFTPGKIYVLGAFTDWNGNANTLNVVKLNANGTYDNTFASGLAPGQKGLIFIHELSNGDLLISGQDFNTETWNATPLSSWVIRVNSTGAAVDLGWGSVTGDWVYDSALLPSGEIVLVGTKTTLFNGYSTIGVYSEAGVLNTTYNPQSSFDNDVFAIEVMLNGDYLLCGGTKDVIYQGYGNPESLIALDLSTGSSFNARQIHTGDPEVIVVEAISPNRFAPQGYSETYGDLVEFNPICNTMAFPDPNGLTNGNLLPNGNIISGFDLQWDGQNAYFMMPAGYPILFGHLFYIDWATTSGGNYYFFGDPVLPGINYNKEDYGVDSGGFSVPYITISNDGMKVTLNGVTEQQFLDYDPGSLDVDACIESQGPAYGHMNRRTDVNNEISFPLDWRNFRYRRYERDPAIYSILKNEYVQTSDAGSTGNYKDYPVVAIEAFSFQVSGRGGTTAYWFWNGTVENFAMPQWLFTYNVNLLCDYINNVTIVNTIRHTVAAKQIHDTAFYSVFGCSFMGSIINSSITNLIGVRIENGNALIDGVTVNTMQYVTIDATISGNLESNVRLNTQYNKRIFVASNNITYLEYFNGTVLQYVTSPF